MAIPVIGSGAMLGIGEESTWGTAVSRTNWKDMVSMGLRRTISKRPVPELGRYGQASSNHRYDYIENDFAGGPLSFVVSYNDSTLLLLKHIMGDVATTGAGPYNHEFTLASPPPIGLTLEQIRGKHATMDTAEVFEGCKLNGMRMSISAGGLMMIETEVIAQTSARAAAGTPTATSGGERIRHNHAASVSVTWNSNVRPVNSFSLTLERNLERNQELGSQFTSEPYESDGLSVLFEMRRKWQDEAFDDDFEADTQSTLALDFNGSSGRAFEISMPGAKIYDVEREVSSRGAIEQVIRGRALATSTSEGLRIIVTNANATAEAN
jgi:hypothetical protein